LIALAAKKRHLIVEVAEQSSSIAGMNGKPGLRLLRLKIPPRPILYDRHPAATGTAVFPLVVVYPVQVQAPESAIA